jgi:hypothetical protein
MIEPNVINFFIILLSGFGVVWSYRHFTSQQNKHIGEFEYTAFSALWGIPFGFLLLWAASMIPKSADMFDSFPMSATVLLFPLAVACGYAGAQIKKILRK